MAAVASAGEPQPPRPIHEDDVDSIALFLEKFQMAFRQSAVTVMRQAFEDWMAAAVLQ